MSLKFSFNPLRVVLFTLILLSAVCTLNAQGMQPPPQPNAPSWFINHLPLIGLILSESFAFLPTKAKGITQLLLNVATGIFKKKLRLKSKSS